jgi:hypothetical protein
MKDLTRQLAAAVITIVSLTGGFASAQTNETSSMPQAGMTLGATADEDKWTFNSPLFLWAPALNGTATLKGNSIRASQSFTDLYDHMDKGFMAYLELGKPQYGFYVNPNYFALNYDGKAGPLKATLDLDLLIIEMVGYYRVWNTGGDRPASLDVLGGARYWNLHENLQLKSRITGTSTDAETQWLLDPMIGLRFNDYITKRMHITAQADVGGFDLGYQTSRFSWQLMGTVGYDFTMPVIKKPSTVFAGWRQINLQKTQGNNAINLTFSGILLGLNVQLF